ncbi:hypothetical protein BJF85_20625 [Saccharomonospora sp. CUA-673]|uniref:DUF397 domain-containing protein n=1 Tax=Saccharomonospora sp. CUA-673 TaxID=1904969 RepID=UPI0009666D61|nr:DUF397 domain-containing protein [Saccharomonospora sp. CUA-673]OLT44112.1 hypothetical protein BJF85_20625 [Saccharomonospora sp. CUA-673]
MNNTQSASSARGWFKSSFSNPSQECVEVRFDGDVVHVRDTKDHGTGPVLSVPAGYWADFLEEVMGRAPAGSNTAIEIVVHADGGVDLRTHHHAAGRLSYTAGEWSAFVAGVRGSEFDLPVGGLLAV